METHGAVGAKMERCNNSIIHGFQVVNKQVDIPCDGILGREFLQRARVKICYETRTVMLNGARCEMVGTTKQLETEGTKRMRTGQIKLPPRKESIVRVSVASISPQAGMMNKSELQKCVILAASLTKVVDGNVVTSVLNTGLNG